MHTPSSESNDVMVTRQPSALRYFIYSYTDVRPGHEGQKIYIGKGSTKNPKSLNRMHIHWQKRDHKNPFFDSILKEIRVLGMEPIRQLVSWHDTMEEVFEAEKANIKLYKRLTEGGTLCNLTIGGEGPNGAIHAPEMAAKKSEISKDRWNDRDFKAKTSQAIKLAKASPEFRAKVSEINKEIWNTPGVKEAFSARMKEVLNNPEEKSRKAATTKAMWNSPEFRAKQMATRAELLALNPPMMKPPKLTKEEVSKKRADGVRAAAARRTPEQRAKIAEGLSERSKAFAAKRKAEQIAAGLRLPDMTPEERVARRSANLKAVWDDPEVRARHSANLKATLAKPEVKARKVEAGLKLWGDEAKAKLKAKWTQQRRAEQSAKMKAVLANMTPEMKAKKAQDMRDRNSDPAYKAKIAAGVARAKSK